MFVIMIHFPPTHTQKCIFSPQSIFYPLFLNEDGRIKENVLVSCIIDFDDIQLCLRQFCLNLNICKVMTIFFKFWPKKIRKTVITLQILKFKQNGLSQSWISSKSIMQLTKTIFQNSAIFIEKKCIENRLWGKSAFFWGKRINSSRYHAMLGSGPRGYRTALPQISKRLPFMQLPVSRVC